MTENDKFRYFLSKYRSLDDEELTDLTPRINSLAEEASTALRQVLSERGVPAPQVSTQLPDEPRELTEEERKEQSKVSSALWNGPVAKRVEFLFAAQALMFGGALAGSQGLRLGALPLVAITGLLMYFARKLGKATTRSICADAETTIEDKTKSLKSLSLWLWPALLLSSAAGIVVARAFTGA
jgi:hypothetical protein